MTQNVPDSAGVPEAYASKTLTAVYNDLDSVKALFETCGEQIAALIAVSYTHLDVYKRQDKALSHFFFALRESFEPGQLEMFMEALKKVEESYEEN